MCPYKVITNNHIFSKNMKFHTSNACTYFYMPVHAVLCACTILVQYE